MEREVLKITPQEGRSIIYEDNEEFEIVCNDVVNNSRWSIIHDIVVRRLSDGKFFKSSYSVGATECQDERPYEYGEAVFIEVFEREKTIIVYE